IAHVFAQNNFSVSLCDVSKEMLGKALATIGKNLDRQVAKAALTTEAKDNTLGNISVHTSLADAAKNADLVIEAATENIELKKKIFRDMDSMSPASAILATNTSSISITFLASETKCPDTVICLTFMNLVPVMNV